MIVFIGYLKSYRFFQLDLKELLQLRSRFFFDFKRLLLELFCLVLNGHESIQKLGLEQKIVSVYGREVLHTTLNILYEQVMSFLVLMGLRLDLK